MADITIDTIQHGAGERLVLRGVTRAEDGAIVVGGGAGEPLADQRFILIGNQQDCLVSPTTGNFALGLSNPVGDPGVHVGDEFDEIGDEHCLIFDESAVWSFLCMWRARAHDTLSTIEQIDTSIVHSNTAIPPDISHDSFFNIAPQKDWEGESVFTWRFSPEDIVKFGLSAVIPTPLAEDNHVNLSLAVFAVRLA